MEKNIRLTMASGVPMKIFSAMRLYRNGDSRNFAVIDFDEVSGFEGDRDKMDAMAQDIQRILVSVQEEGLDPLQRLFIGCTKFGSNNRYSFPFNPVVTPFLVGENGSSLQWLFE